MIGEEGYRALERGDLITAFNEFSAAEKRTNDPIERSMMMINQGALLIAMGKYALAVEKLIMAKALLKQNPAERKLLAVACLNLSKAMIYAGKVRDARTEADCAASFLGNEDPHLLYVRALIKFYENDKAGLLEIKTEGLPEPYRKLILVLQLKINSDKRYTDVLKELIPSSQVRDALGLV